MRIVVATLALLAILVVAEPLSAQNRPATRPAPRPGGLTVQGDVASRLRVLESRFYEIHTDVGDDLAREAYVRLDRMFEEYAQRTASFSKPPTRKFPFYLFSQAEDYYAAGAIRGSAGVFMARGDDARLMAFVQPRGQTWHVVQHEGFHQFAYMSIARNLPMWVNEGLAEYFGEARFTGDAMVSGVIPDHRRIRVRTMIERGRFERFATYKSITPARWNAELRIENYDQAWSMVQFMAEADGGKYQKAFLQYMQALSRGEDNEKAWTNAVGANQTEAFEAAWRKWWLNLPEHPTTLKFQQARMMTLVSFLARSRSAGQKWDSARDFAQAARDGRVRMSPDPKIWLPSSLLNDAVEELGDDATVRLDWDGMTPTLSKSYPTGTSIRVTMTTRSGRPVTVAEVRGGR